MVTPDTQFMLWGSAYVILKWTVGVWAFRQARAYIAGRDELDLEHPLGLG
jgi:hypothetical protein